MRYLLPVLSYKGSKGIHPKIAFFNSWSNFENFNLCVIKSLNRLFVHNKLLVPFLKFVKSNTVTTLAPTEKGLTSVVVSNCVSRGFFFIFLTKYHVVSEGDNMEMVDTCPKLTKIKVTNTHRKTYAIFKTYFNI